MSDRGFVLVEVLLTLSITLAIVTLPSFMMETIRDDFEDQLYINEVASQMNLMQAYSLLTENTGTVYLSSRLVKFQANDYFTILEAPNHMYLSSSGSRYFSFKSDTGATSHLTTFIFESPRNRWEMAIQLGSGRYDIKKVK